MKLQTSSAAVDVKTNMQMTSIKAELAQDKLHKMWDLLQSPYRDPIASLIREYVSNCFDSHIEAGVDTPVYVTLEEDQSSWYWACEDFGVGLSPDRCKNIFMKYLTSTKEETNDQIGAFGMGSKSGLGYTDVVHIRTRFDGTEYKYMLHKTTDAPTLALMDSYPTNKGNGTQVKVYLKDNWDETEKFKRKTQQQLTYFDNVHYGGKLSSLNEEFVLFKGKSFWIKPGCTLDNTHLVIGKVAYPINWENIGLGQINMPVALNFNIGDLPVIFTREDIRYTDDAIQKIKSKIKETEKELIDLATPKSKDIDDLFIYKNMISGQPSVKFSDTYSMLLPEYLCDRLDTTGITYTPNPHLNKELIEDRYSHDGIDKLFASTLANYRKLQNGRNISCNWHSANDKFRKTRLTPNSGGWQPARILMDEPSEPRKNRWIATEINNYADLYTDYRDQLKLKDYINILKLTRGNRDTWRHQIKWFQEWQNEHFEKFFDYRYSELEVDEEFEKRAKAGMNRVVVGTDEIRYKEYRETEYVSWKSYDSDLYVTADLKKNKIENLTESGLIIWSIRSEELALRCTWRLLNNLNARGFGTQAKIISVAKRDVEVMEILSEENDNIMNLSDWYTVDNPWLECFVFFQKYGTLVSHWTESLHTYQKPIDIPYVKYASQVHSYCDRLPKGFKEHLVKIFYLQGKELKLDKLPALKSWRKAEKHCNSICKKLGVSDVDSQAIIGIRLAPNRPVSSTWRDLKNNLLINNL